MKMPALLDGVTVAAVISLGAAAASLVLGAFIGLDTGACNTLAASFQAGSSADEVLDIVFADPAELDDGGVL